MPIQLGCELPRMELEMGTEGGLQLGSSRGEKNRRKIFQRHKCPGEKFNVRIKLPFPSLKGKTGGVKKRKWGSRLGSV